MKQFRLLYKYIIHFFSARNSRGHGVHSPFIFYFTNFVLNNSESYYIFPKIESIRFDLRRDKRTIDVEDFGAGNHRVRAVSDITAHSLKSPKYGQLLFRIANFLKTKNVLELGTSLGITASYLASSSKDIRCISLEGCPQTAMIAQDNFKKLGLENIKIVVGNIDDTLRDVLTTVDSLDLIFFDANHRSESVLNYFDQCLLKVSGSSVMVIDDIYWSADMESAWKKIKDHPKVMSTIDLFQVGIVFFNPDLHKKHYKMRY
jgi:predicted O-methyltransferase YrrM